LVKFFSSFAYADAGPHSDSLDRIETGEEPAMRACKDLGTSRTAPEGGVAAVDSVSHRSHASSRKKPQPEQHGTLQRRRASAFGGEENSAVGCLETLMAKRSISQATNGLISSTAHISLQKLFLRKQLSTSAHGDGRMQRLRCDGLCSNIQLQPRGLQRACLRTDEPYTTQPCAFQRAKRMQKL